MKKLNLGGLLRVVALVLIVTLVWGFARDRLSLENWKIPIEYGGDGLEVIGWVKSASEGEFVPFWKEGSHRLNAPYGADWADYPATEKFLIFFLGQLSNVIGLFQACNFGMLLEHVLSALSFYWCCRILRLARIWSFVGAIIYAFTYYASYRNLGHLHLAAIYTLPFAMLSAWLVLASRSMRLGDRFAWICLGTAAVMSVSGPYYLNMYAQMLCFGLMVQYLTKRRRENIRIAIYSLGIVMVGFIAINARTFVYEALHGKNEFAVSRNYFQTELYALKPMEFFMPPNNHHVGFMSALGDFYASQAWVRGEMFSSYLGIIGIIGFFWLFGEAFLCLIRAGKGPRRFPAYAIQTCWFIFYAVIGGMNCLIALGGIQFFRSSNRYSVFVSVTVMLFLVSRMSRLSRRWTPGLKFGLAAAIVLIGLYDQLPRQLAPDVVATIEGKIAADRIFSAQLEEKLPPGGMVFELPVMTFPEAMPIRDVQGYDMMRPYFYTKTVRFSYGAVKGRTREDWQAEVEKMPAPQMISTLEKLGFSAIYLNRQCYEDAGEGLLKQLAAAGRDQIINDERHEQVAVLLHPAAIPELPHSDRRAQILFKNGWAVKGEGDRREWSRGDATISFFSEAHYTTTYQLRCVIGSISPRHVSIEMKGREIWAGQIGAGEGVPVSINVDGAHGYNNIEFKTDGHTDRPKGANVSLAFTLVNLEIARNGDAD